LGILPKGASALAKVKGDLLLSPENLSALVRKILADKFPEKSNTKPYDFNRKCWIKLC